VRQFHGKGQSFAARGLFRVRHGDKRLARLLAWLMRLPAPGEAVELRLQVVCRDGGEEWRRSFAGRPFVSWQTAHPQGWLLERTGMTQLRFHLTVQEGALHYTTARVAVGWGWCRLPLPRWLAPNISAWEKAAEGGCQVNIEARLPLLGRLVAYEGLVIREEATP
jgi:hypothetical protein